MPLIESGRAHHIQLRREQQKSIVASRKRKLRELYSASQSLDAIPIFPTHPDAPPTSPGEAHFLEQNDLTKNRFLDEQSIPTTRRLRSQTAKRNALSNGSNDPTISSSTAQTNSARPAREPSTSYSRSAGAEQPQQDGKSGSKDPARDSSSATILGTAATANAPEAPQTRLSIKSQDEQAFGNSSEAQRIRSTVENRPGSPGIELQQVVPVSSDDSTLLPRHQAVEPKDEHHRAATVHLPSKEVQEARLHQEGLSPVDPADAARTSTATDGLSIVLPPHSHRSIDPMSSPGSTNGPHSATTPGLHEASTDTSPDNDGPRYDGVRESIDKEGGSPTVPPELQPDEEEVRRKEEHDRVLRAQMELARNEILGSSPTAADAQLRLEEEQAAASESINRQDSSSEGKANMTQSASVIVQDTIDDEEDEVIGVPTPEDDTLPERHVPQTATAQEAREGDRMDVDEHAQALPMNAKNDSPVGEQRISSVQVDEAAAGSSTASPHLPADDSQATPAPERSRTRLSSGAMRQKSVSEILGETPRSTVAVEKTIARNSSSPRSLTPQTPASHARSLTARARDKDRSKLSTVVFAKQPLHKTSGNSLIVPGNTKPQTLENATYFLPLMQAQALNSIKGHQSLDSMLQSSNKTITTADAYIPFHDNQNQKLLRRVHAMQSSDKWSFRQPKRAPEPNRPSTHRDEMLKEMKWMRTDFRQEKKWKMAMARNVAYACAEWVATDPSDRYLLQIKVKQIQPGSDDTEKDIVMGGVDPSVRDDSATPELDPSAEGASPKDDFEDEISTSLLDSVPPTAIFSFTDDDLVFHLSRSSAADKILDELPMYGTPLSIPSSDLPALDVDPDAAWKRPALPLSKYVEGKIVLKIDAQPKKRSRYDYEEESDDEDRVVIGAQSRSSEQIEPPSVDVALFNPENKHIRDRIQAGHQFRPPSENPMPLQSFFESRSSSHWLWAEDDELKGLVREYSYNWQLISSMLSSKSLFTSGAERRTPWECFERWIHLEGLPADMSKTHYFRAYNHRLEAAQRTLMLQAQKAAQQPTEGSAGPAAPPIRRRTTTSIRVERKRNNKHLSLVDAMRKLAKKRETNLQKQAHAQSLASMRKEANQPPQSMQIRHTPQEFSKLKHDREVQIQERMQRLAMQQNAQRQAIQQARNAQSHPHQQHYNGLPPNGANHAARASQPGGNQGMPQHSLMQGRPNQLAVPGQNIPQASMLPPSTGMQAPPLPNGGPRHAGLPMNTAPREQLAGSPGVSGQGQQRMPTQSEQEMYRRTAAVREAQRQKIAQTQQQPGQSPHMRNVSPNVHPNMNGQGQRGFGPNGQPIPQGYNGTNGNVVSTPPANNYNMSNGSPRMGPPYPVQQANGRMPLPVSDMEAKLRASNPNMTPEQIRKIVSDQIASQSRPQLGGQNINQNGQTAQAQSAMMAAAGAPSNGLPVNFANGAQPDPRQYAQMLRAQQREQANQQAMQGAQSNTASAPAPPQQPQTTSQAPQAPMQAPPMQPNRSASSSSIKNT